MEVIEGEVLTQQETVFSKPPVHRQRLTGKQKAFIKEIKQNPKITATEAARRAYGVATPSAHVIGSNNMRNPRILSKLNDMNEESEVVISNAITDFGNSPDVKERALAVETAKWVHDKIHGKAVRKVETTNLNVNIEQLFNNLK